MKIIFRKSTVQITDGDETRILLKDSPNYWSAVSEALEKYLKGGPVKPELKTSYDELTNSIRIEGGTVWEKDWVEHVSRHVSNEKFHEYYYE